MFSSFAASAQYSGNAVLEEYNRETIRPSLSPAMTKVYLSDSSFLISANVLVNVIADSYVATFGVAESALSLREANIKMDKRISAFTADLAGMHIAPENIYIDVTTQTQISDYKVSGDYAEEYVLGFQQKKNVIVKFKRVKDLDQILAFASSHAIYDLAKVDYIVEDVNKIYVQLFRMAMEVVNEKKELYTLATNTKAGSRSEVYGEAFRSFYPVQLYKTYTPNVSTVYENYSSYGKRKGLAKNATYYYNKVDYTGFDKIINPAVVEPAVEFTFSLQVKFAKDDR